MNNDYFQEIVNYLKKTDFTFILVFFLLPAILDISNRIPYILVIINELRNQP